MQFRQLTKNDIPSPKKPLTCACSPGPAPFCQEPVRGLLPKGRVFVTIVPLWKTQNALSLAENCPLPT